MRTEKQALLSPAIDAMNAPVGAEDEQRIFETKFGDMAYGAFSGKFPDLVSDIVTFKVLDADTTTGTAVGAFIMEAEGEYIYVPVILADNALKPFDIMYIKSKDMFVPLTDAWLDETSRSTLSSLGEGTKLPSTVATDVDIRNIVVPPTTGRYSYASVSPKIKLAAASTEPLGRKLANMMTPFPPNEMEQQPDQFNPALWEAFVDQFNKIHAMTPGQAIDQNLMDIDQLAKTYKSHLKTWSLDQPTGVPKQAYDYSSIGSKLDAASAILGRGAAYGAASGAAQAGKDFELADVPGAALRGAVGGALLAPVGRAVGRSIAHHHVRPRSQTNLDMGGTYGTALGGVLGGLAATQAPPDTISQLTTPSPEAWAEYYQNRPPPPYMTRTGSDYMSGLKAMVKHAAKNPGRAKPQLLAYLSKAPNNVKTAFASLLRKDKRILKTAASLYGSENLLKALQLHKTAGVSHIGGGLYIADKNTTANEYAQSFGSNKATAFRGVALRSYYYKDTRPSLNHAVQVQAYRDFQEAKDAGVYRMYNVTGDVEPALIVVAPIDLIDETDSIYYPKQNKVIPVRGRAAREVDSQPEPHSYQSSAIQNPNKDVDRSHAVERLALFGNGDYCLCERIAGEQVTEVFLKDTPLYARVMTDKKAAPETGKGVFVYRHGGHYYATKPVEISNLRDNQGEIRGTIATLGGFGEKNFVIDKRSPINRVMRLRDQNLVVIPNSWSWVPVKDKRSSEDYITSDTALTTSMLDALTTMGASKIVVRDAGQGQFAVSGEKTTDKVASLRTIATKYRVHAKDAEALLKIASHTGMATAYALTPKQFRVLRAFEKQAQGQMMPPEMPPEQNMPPMQAAPAPAAPSAPSAVDQAFAESMQGLSQQMANLQAQLSVLQQVQDRAMQIEQEQAGGAASAPPDMQMADPSMEMPDAAPEQYMDPSMQGQGMDPSMQDPSMQGQGMDSSMQDPSMQGQGMDPSQQQGQQSYPMMFTEQPTSTEIEQQINPDFLAQAGELEETGAFDAGAIASLAKDPSLKDTTSDYAAGLEATLDDIGRTLLTLYMQSPTLKEELGENEFTKLENQLRDSFKGLGELILNLTHQTPLLPVA